MIDILALYAILATTFTIGKSAMQFCSPFIFVAARMIVAGSGLLFFCRMRSRGSTSIARSDYGLMAQLIVFHVVLAYSLEFWALTHLDSGLVALTYNLSPFITALLGYVLYSAPLHRGQLVGLSIGFMGIIPLLWVYFGSSNWVVSSAPIWAYWLLLCAVASACYGWLLMKQLVSSGTYAPPVINGWAMLIGGILCAVIAYCVEPRPFIFTDRADQLWISRTSLGQVMSVQHQVLLHVGLCLLGLVLISNVLFYNAYAYLLRRYSATFLSFAGMLTPLFAALLGLVVLHEPILPVFLLSAGITSIGLTTFYVYE